MKKQATGYRLPAMFGGQDGVMVREAREHEHPSPVDQTGRCASTPWRVAATMLR
jgi:hypothetical protein